MIKKNRYSQLISVKAIILSAASNSVERESVQVCVICFILKIVHKIQC